MKQLILVILIFSRGMLQAHVPETLSDNRQPVVSAYSEVGGLYVRQPSFRKYRVKKKDSLYFIARRYGLEVEDILRYNPQARDGIEKGMILRIPDPDELERMRVPVSVSHPAGKEGKQDGQQSDTETPNSLGAEFSREVVLDTLSLGSRPGRFSIGKTYHVGLLLPFYLPANDTINRIRITPEELMADSLTAFRMENSAGFPVDSFRQREESIVFPRSANFLHFYEGVLLAVDSMRKAGMDVRLHVFDTDQKKQVVDSLVNTGKLDGLDLIVGPIFPELQGTVSEFARTRQIPVVSPLSSAGNFESSNPWYFKVNPDKDVLIRRTVDYLSGICPDKNVIVVRTGLYRHLPEARLVDLLRERMQVSGERDSTGHIRFREYTLASSGTGGLENLLQKERDNIILIPSDTEARISEVVTSLNSLTGEFPVTLVGLSSFPRYRSIQTEYFHRSKLTFLSPYYVNYRDSLVNRFIRSFRAEFAAEPNQYSFQGYDVAFYFLSALFRYGRDFRSCLSHMQVHLLQSEPSFVRVSQEGGFLNQGLFVIQYQPDFDIMMKGVTGILSRKQASGK
ncbi:MAG: LysM peptidoglycan-binding domain-containing protein [Mangrovibacterium sp.]